MRSGYFPVFGPSAPARAPALFFVTATGVHFDIEAGSYSQLRDWIKAGKPLMLTAERADVYYRWSDESSGGTISPVATSPTGSAAVLFATQNPERLEMAPVSTKGLLAMTATAGQTGILRVWAVD